MAIPRNHVKIVLVDATAKVEKEEIYKTTTGGDGMHILSNNNGIRFIIFTTENKMKIMSIYFRRKKIYKKNVDNARGKGNQSNRSRAN